MNTFIIILIVIIVILYIQHKTYFESFERSADSEPLTLLVFVSKSCGHCVNYNNNYHDDVVTMAKQKGVDVKRIFSDEDTDNMFDKFKIMYVPTGIIMKGNSIYKNLGSNVNLQTIKTALN